MVLSLNIEDAFYHIRYSSVRNSLNALNFPSNAIETLKDILNDRIVSIQTAHGPVYWPKEPGCAQGSCSGPLFWNDVANFNTTPSLELMWLLSWLVHFGIPGKEAADDLAKLATTEGNLILLPAPRRFLKKKLSEISNNRWQHQLDIEINSRNIYRIMPIPIRRHSDKIHFTTGHGPYPNCLYLRLEDNCVQKMQASKEVLCTTPQNVHLPTLIISRNQHRNIRISGGTE
ncbi:hypothetical protein AVEN_232215-1 [Araneus ventricosus]|uniref:Uncharacterized protein n=1 Tax=Araneus ventricosus TaxID=182803 RepID=A0A4Y2SWX1_ARAVE|nr:hypothetical protein AVEN_232215-1 [Araneus ventricosus]